MPALGSKAPMPDAGDILVLGIGNLLWADEGFGVRAVQALHEQWRFPPRVRLMDGGTQGFNLLTHVHGTEQLIVFDAVDYGLPGGTLKILWNGDVPRFLGAKKLSLHQTGFQDVLAAAELTGGLPAELVLIGVQPVDFENYGGSLNAPVRACILPALEVALDCLRRWGIQPEPRAEAVTPLLPPSLEMAAYELVMSDE